jgi:diaminohydroxyphosphoribosylaminopyrimidine deaminase / 5-amino-6-(5-phosphoribosylamino)uracil reductase
MNHSKYMLMALGQAQLYWGMTQPNPAVGAVAVKQNEVIAVGAHRGAGFPHAEVVCLNSAQHVRGSDLYVTLEPCCHHGRTPPCTDIIIDKGIKTVYFAFFDPNPQVAGQGQQRLIEAGIECVHLPCGEVDEFYHHYHYYHQTRLPWVTVKLAVTADGAVAGHAKKPIPITGEQALAYTHINRKRYGAILTTAETLLQDNPLLNVRLTGESVSKPIFVIDRQLRLTPSLRIWDSAHNVVVFHSNSVKPSSCLQQQKKCRTISVAENQQGLNLDDIIAQIGSMGYHDVWCELGPTMFYSFMQSGVANQVLVYVSNKLAGEGAYLLKQQLRLGDGHSGGFQVTGLGSDTLFDWTTVK